MAADFSLESSAAKYEEMYRRAVDRRRSGVMGRRYE